MGSPVLIKDVADEVRFGHAVRYGAFTENERESVGGQILMLKGENPNEVIQNVRKRIAEIQKSLPQGLRIEPFLDRSALIERTTSTVTKNLVEGALIVIFVLVILLGSLRGGLITASIIPLSLLFAFILMKQFGVWANLMSLGAIDFGIIVDGAVIIVEGVVHLIEKKVREAKERFTDARMDELAYEAGSTMMNSAFFGQLIILIVFAPILFLTGVEGKMFRPMAYTFGFAVLGAIILCLTYVPAVSALLLKPAAPGKNNIFVRIEKFIEHISEKIMSAIYRVYRPVINLALNFRKSVIILALSLFVSAGYTFSRMGGEFIPKLDEGDIAMQALIKPGSALSETIDVSIKLENIIMENFPEVKTMVSRIGVAEIPTDPMPMDIADTYIILEKDMDKWVSASSKEELLDKIKEKISVIPGVNFVFTQPVELRFNELLTGVREDVAIKLYGDDLKILAEKAQEMARIIRTVRGAADVRVEATSGLPQMTVQYDRAKLAQYGLDIDFLNRYVSSAFAGASAGVIFEGEKRFELVIRLAAKYRQDIGNLMNLYVDLPNGEQVPLKEVADISYQPGPMQISRDNTYRRIYVGVNVRGRDVESMVEEIQEKLDAQFHIPPGYYITYGGSFENLKRAKERLAIVVPIALALIFILLYFALHSLSESIMIYMAVPLAAIGGVFSLTIRGMPFSISAGVGFVVLFGVAVMNGLVLINRLNDLKIEGVSDIKERVFLATRERLRPILLTATAAIMGFTPMALSQSAGAEVQRPLATVVIGGLISATFLTLVVIPVLYYYLESSRNKSNPGTGALNKAPLLLVTVLFLVGGMVSGNKLNAQDKEETAVLNIEQAVELAKKNDPSLKTATYLIERETSLKKTSWDLGSTQVFTGAEERGNEIPGIQTNIGFRQNNIDLFTGPSKSRFWNARIGLGEQFYSMSEQELVRNVLTAYYQISYTKGQLKLAIRLDSIYTDFQRAAQLRYEHGETGRLEWIAATTQYQQIQVLRQQADDDLEIARRALQQWLNLSQPPDIVEEDIIEAEGLELDGDSSSVSDNPLLKFYRQQIEVNMADENIQKAGMLPKLALMYGFQNVDGQTGFYTYEAGLSFPLWFGPQSGRIQAARAEVHMAQSNYERQYVDMLSTLRQRYKAYEKLTKTINYYKEHALQLSDEQIEAAVKSYKAGEIEYVDYIQNLNNAITVQQNYLQFLNQHNQLVVEIKFLLGQL